MARYADITEMTDEDWDWHFDIVLRHAFLAMQYGGRAMQAHGGAMVFVASVSGITSAPRHSAYGAAKAGLMSLVRTGAVELGPSGIRVNAVAPGVVWTPRVSAFLGEEGRERNIANTPLRRVAQPADIAAALLFLASDLAGYVTGQTLDGRRRRRGQVPVPDGRPVTAGSPADPFVRGCAWPGTDDIPYPRADPADLDRLPGDTVGDGAAAGRRAARAGRRRRRRRARLRDA